MKNNGNMNKTELDILAFLKGHAFVSQRNLAEELGCSLGMVNQSLHRLEDKGMMTAEGALTVKAGSYLEERRPRRAVILAAGPGMRMVPINREVSKGMLEMKGEVLVERLICQLLEAGVQEIHIVVGFMKEQYEYLIDRYGVDLIVNREYEKKNNLFSLSRAAQYLENAYIVPCDIWCGKNPFRRQEAYSWYLVQQEKTYKSDVILNKKGELVRVKPAEEGNQMVGIAYVTGKVSKRLAERLVEMAAQPHFESCFWEEALYEKQKMAAMGRIDPNNEIYEVNTYEQLRQMDEDSRHLDSDIIRLIGEIFQVNRSDVKDIEVLKKGMTNRSFRFACKGKRFIMRIPGEGTNRLIDRAQEYEVYQVIEQEQICDKVYYMNPQNGYKITEFLEGVRNCDPCNKEDVAACMQFLKQFHEKKLQVGHAFDLFERIDYYENLWNGQPSIYRDYDATKSHVLELKDYIDGQKKGWSLTHIDAVPDNFLLSDNGIRLIDWEYAAMQDPHLDIAMFAIYSLYSREEVEFLIDSYFEGDCPWEVRLKIYCYIAAAGLLWSNWCEYKRLLGVEFGEYSLRQYRYAKEYYCLFRQLTEQEKGGSDA